MQCDVDVEAIGGEIQRYECLKAVKKAFGIGRNLNKPHRPTRDFTSLPPPTKLSGLCHANPLFDLTCFILIQVFLVAFCFALPCKARLLRDTEAAVRWTLSYPHASFTAFRQSRVANRATQDAHAAWQLS